MLYIPVNAAIATAVFRAKASEGMAFPATLTQLYGELCSLLLQRYLLREKIVEIVEDLPLGVEDSHFPADVREHFLSLAESAFKGTLSQQLVFPSLPPGSRSLGLTTGSPELHTGRRLSYNFLHLTVQEYLAAVHVSTLTSEQQKEIFEKHLLEPHLERMWQFIAGLNRRAIDWDLVRKTEMKISGAVLTYNRGLSTVFESSVRSKGDFVGRFLLGCLYEAQGRVLCGAVLGAGKVIFADHFSLTPFDSFALGYCIACSRCTWDLASTDQVHLWPELVQGIRSVDPHHIQSSIHALHVVMSQENLACLKDLPFRKVSNLDLRHCRLSHDTLAHTVIPVLSRLEHLGVDLPTGSDAAVVLKALVKDSPSLRSLELEVGDGCFGLKSPEFVALRELITTNRLNQLTLGGTLTRGGKLSNHLVATIFGVSALETVTFSQCCVPSIEDVSTMALLSENTNLKNLTFELVTVDAHELVDLASALHQNTTMVALNITCHVSPSSTDDRSRPDVIASAFAEMLKVNRSLKRLTFYLYRPPITVQGATVLAEAVNVNITLEELDLHSDCTQQEMQLNHCYPNIHNRTTWDNTL